MTTNPPAKLTHPCPNCAEDTLGVFLREGEDSALCPACFLALLRGPCAEFGREIIHGCDGEEGSNRDFAAGDFRLDGNDGARGRGEVVK